MGIRLEQAGPDLKPCQYGYSPLEFRGPRADLDAPYVAFVGGTETVAPLIAKPFCDQVAEEFGIGCVNLGIKNAGVDVFLNDPEVMRILSQAEFVVLEVLGAANLSNAFYNVHPRRNDRFTRALDPLLSEARRLDLTEVHFTGHLHSAIRDARPRLHRRVISECQQMWLSRMHRLIAQIDRPVHVLRIVPDRPARGAASYIEPHMVASIATAVSTITRVELSDAVRYEARDDYYFADGEAISRNMLPAQAHQDIAGALIATIQGDGKRKARAGGARA